MSTWADPRFTRDVDLCVAVEDDQQAEQVVAAMRARDYRIETIIEHEWVQRLATVRLSLPALGGVVVVNPQLGHRPPVPRSRRMPRPPP